MTDNVGIKFTGDASDLQRALATSGSGVEQFGRRATADLQRFGVSSAKSAKEVDFAIRGLPAQFTDIATSLQAGQSPLTVFLQQGGQIKDMFGGVGPAVRAMSGYLIGLINPLSLTAAGLAAVGVAYYQGSKEATAFNAALAMTNNAAGTTVSDLTEMAKRISAVSGTQAAASAGLAMFAGSSNIASESLERFTAIALALEKETDQPLKKTLQIFTELGQSPVEASAKLNKETNHLTAAVWEQIKALDEQGRAAEAGALAQKAYADSTEQALKRIVDNLGYLERGWRAIVSGAKAGWDAMLGVGRANTMQEQLADAQNRLAERQTKGPLNEGTSAAFEKGNQALRERIAFLSESIRVESRSAEASKASADAMKARIAWDQQDEKYLSKAEKLRRAVTKAEIEGVAAGKSRAEIDERIRQIRASDTGGASKGLAIDKAELSLDLAAIKRANIELIDNYSNANKIVESLRAAGRLSDSEYYQSKLQFINLETDAKARALTQEIERYQQEKVVGKDRIDNERKIAEAQSALVVLQAHAAVKREILLNQEIAAVKRLELAQLSARQAAEDYFAVQQRQQNRTLGDIGAGTRQRDLNAGINQIEDKYGAQRRDLENEKARLELEGKFTADAQTQYNARLAIINEFQAKSIESYREYFDKLTSEQGNWARGASEALRNYYDDANNTFKQTEALVTKAFGGMEDALVGFVKTGKLDFKSLADSIITDIIRIQVRKGIAGVFGGPGGVGGGLGGDLLGGAITAAFSGTALGGGGFGSGLAYGNQDLGLSFDGGGYTGDAPRSGGLDGKGGFMAMLHPRETVLDHTKGQGTGGVTFAPVTNITVAGGIGAGEAATAIRQALAENNRQWTEQLKRQGVLA